MDWMWCSTFIMGSKPGHSMPGLQAGGGAIGLPSPSAYTSRATYKQGDERSAYPPPARTLLARRIGFLVSA